MKIRKAVSLGAWEVVGGTYSEHLPYQVNLDPNVRQWVLGTKTIKEIIGQPVETFNYQEFVLFPQLPMFLINVGINKSMYENLRLRCGRVQKDERHTEPGRSLPFLTAQKIEISSRIIGDKHIR